MLSANIRNLALGFYRSESTSHPVGTVESGSTDSPQVQVRTLRTASIALSLLPKMRALRRGAHGIFSGVRV